MTALDIFTYSGQEVRTVTVDDEPWFVAADVLDILELDRTALRRLDEDEVGVDSIHTLGGTQRLNIVSESGLYSLVLGSRKPEAKEFKRWITRKVLPAIRKTGSYIAPANELDQIKALHAAVGTLLEQNAIDAPKAAAWDELASADGDYAVADAAKILARAGVQTGPQRLFEQMCGLNWLHRGAQNKWTPYQTAVDAGYLAEKPMSHHHPRTGDIVLDPPQVRVTIKGLDRLRVRLGTLDLAPTG